MTVPPHNGAPPDPTIKAALRHPASAESFQQRVTATEDHFVVAHMGVPQTAVDSWTLRIDGAVRSPVVLPYDQLLQRGNRTRQICLECAGNPTNPDQPLRRAAAAIWGGILIRDLLEVADGTLPGARFLLMEGADAGPYAGVDSTSYFKYIPLTKALDSESLVAHSMNGAPLPAEHGFPLRAVIPGFYGTNSVKWLTRLSVLEEVPQGRFTTDLYVDAQGEPTWAVRVNSRIVSPAKGAHLACEEHEVWGWAWGEHPVTSVEFSSDEGATWSATHLEERHQDGWQRFHTRWRPEQPGTHVLAARATDAASHIQPARLCINQVQSFRVYVHGR